MLRHSALLFTFISLLQLSNAQAPETMYVQGGMLYDKCGNAITLHGVNYPVMDDWDFPLSSEVSSQIALSGANAVRIQWYIDYGQPGRPAYALKDLDTVISRVARLDMIPIIELHDFTCQPGMGEMASDIVPWFTQADVLDLIDKHKAYLIINLANEYGHVNWAGNPALAQTTYQAAYSGAVIALRNAGIDVPIMIDAPDCGTSSDRLINVASAINNADPNENLIFSVHAYWYAYAQNDSATMRGHIQQMANTGLCFVLGEVANYQDDGSFCTYSLKYSAILHSAVDIKMGWLIWSWYKDGCAARQMSSTGSYAQLTPYGNDVINNTLYGLRNIAVRSPYLLNDGCTMGITNEETAAITVFPNPANDFIHVRVNNATDNGIYALVDAQGRTVHTEHLAGSQIKIAVSHIADGFYILQRNGKPIKKLIIRH